MTARLEVKLEGKPTPETLTRQRWALALAATGFKILELEPGSKKPIGGVLWGVEATTDPDKIKAMFESNPAMNYGVCPGKDHVIIDLDNKFNANGAETFGKLEIENEILPETFRVRTRNAGFHIYLKVSEEVGNSHRFGRGTGIDVRGGHGYVVGPGCAVAGESWGDGLYTPVEGDLDHIAECPEWVRKLLGRPTRRDPVFAKPECELDLPHNIEEAENFLARREPAVAGENGNDWTWQTVSFLRDFGLSDSMALEVILASEWNRTRCVPEWDADELADLIENAWAYSENRPGCKRAPLSRLREIKADPILPEDYREWTVTAGPPITEPEAATDSAAPPVADDPERRRPFKLRSEAEQDKQPDIEWLIPGVLQRETLALFYGMENSFKSFLVLDLMLSASAAVTWASYGGQDALGGFRADKPLTVIYYAGEGARGIEKRRRPAWRKHHNITNSLAFYTVNEMPFFKSQSDVEEMIREIREAGIVPDIIAIDTAARAMSDLDENSAKDTGIFIASCDLLKREFGCAVIAVHHSGKDDRKGARGSTNLPASFDTRFKVTGDTDTLMATIKNEKQKDGEPWSSVIVFQGEQVTLDDGRRSLVFGRVPPGSNSEPSANEKRIAEVRAALVAVGGETRIITTKWLAEEIVRQRLADDPSAADKATLADKDRMVANEKRNLQRQVKDIANGKPGILKPFVVGAVSSGDLSWTLPVDTEE